MAKWAKNTSGSTKTWVGQQIANSAYYQIQSVEEARWANDSTVLTDIGSGDLTIAKDDSGNTDITDTATAINHLKDDSDPKDVDGVKLARTKVTKTGWHYQVHALEFTTSKLNSVFNCDCNGNNLGFVTIKYYDSNDVELTGGTQIELDTNCVKTVVDWEPTYDYELIGGTLYQGVTPTGNARVWVTAVPDLTVAQGGSVPFVNGGLNLKHVGTGRVANIDGRTSKLLNYDATYHTNKIRTILKHDLGGQHVIFMTFNLFRENV